MRHWFVNTAGSVPAAWREALPGAEILPADGLISHTGGGEGVAWLRVSSNDHIGAALAAVPTGAAVALVILCDQPDEEGAAAAIAAGAAGYCNTHAAPEVLRQVALVVGNGGLWVGRSLMQRLITGTARALGPRQHGSRERWSDKLSEREREVASLVANGASNKEIADQLAITERTVKAHLGAIFEKLEVRDRLQLSLRVNGLRV